MEAAPGMVERARAPGGGARELPVAELSVAPSATQARSDARIGRVLRDKWRLDALLGVGGMAAVYAATHRNGTRAAIKILHAEHSVDADAKRRFLREGYVSNSVGHPGAVRVIDDDVAEDGAAFIVMDLLEGETLESRCQRHGGKLAPEEVVLVVDQLLDILAAAHEKGIVHRDVKPDNVFVTTEGKIKLLDFGIARVRTLRPGSVATIHGGTFGTPTFMPPEQALARTDQVDAQSDLWSVGATMFNVLSGRTVHVTQTLNEQLVAHASQPAPPLASVLPEVPAPIAAVVDRALAFQKADRWPGAREMQSALRAAQKELGWRPSPLHISFAASVRTTVVRAPGSGAGPSVALAGTVLPGARRGRRAQTFLLAGGTFALAMAITAGLLLRSGSPRGNPAPTAPEPPRAATSGAPSAASATATATASTTPDPPAAPPPEPVSPPSASAVASAPRPPAPTAHGVSAPKPRPPAAPTAKPSARPSNDDWLDRQH